MSAAGDAELAEAVSWAAEARRAGNSSFVNGAAFCCMIMGELDAPEPTWLA